MEDSLWVIEKSSLTAIMKSGTRTTIMRGKGPASHSVSSHQLAPCAEGSQRVATSMEVDVRLPAACCSPVATATKASKRRISPGPVAGSGCPNGPVRRSGSRGGGGRKLGREKLWL